MQCLCADMHWCSTITERRSQLTDFSAFMYESRTPSLFIATKAWRKREREREREGGGGRERERREREREKIEENARTRAKGLYVNSSSREDKKKSNNQSESISFDFFFFFSFFSFFIFLALGAGAEDKKEKKNHVKITHTNKQHIGNFIHQLFWDDITAWLATVLIRPVRWPTPSHCCFKLACSAHQTMHFRKKS